MIRPSAHRAHHKGSYLTTSRQKLRKKVLSETGILVYRGILDNVELPLIWTAIDVTTL